MEKLINYLKYSGVFIIFELILTFITSLFNLLGLNSGITTIILFISNIILFFILSYRNAIILKKNGLVEGLTMGLLFIFIMYLIKLILFNGYIRLSTIIYYFILLIVSIFSSTLGVNKKVANK